MKSNQKNIWKKTMRYFLGTAITAAVLTGCGGGSAGAPTGPTPQAGGGSGTDTVVITTPTVVVTPVIYIAATSCASGPALTSTVSQAAANALVPSGCPALPATAYTNTQVVATVTSGTLTLTVTNLPAGFVSGVLTATGPASGGVSDVNANGSVAPRPGSSADWATTYTGNLVMNFAGAPSASKTITFVTPANPVLSVTWPANITKLIEVGIVNGAVDQSKKVTVWTLMSPIATDVGNNADWNANLINGNVKIVKSGEMANDINGVSRNIWRAIFFNPVTNGYCFTPINSHDGSPYNGDSRTSVSCFSSSPDYMIGVSDTNTAKNGLIYRAGNVCYFTTVARGSESISCPF